MPTHSAPGTFRTFLSKSDPCVPVPIIPKRTVSEAAGACAAQSIFGSSNVTVPPATPAITDPAIRTKPRRVMPFMRAQTSWRTIAREFNGTTSCYGQQNRFASNKCRHQPNHFALHQRRRTVPRRLVIGCCGRSGAILGIGSILMQPRSRHFCYAKIILCHVIGHPGCLRCDGQCWIYLRQKKGRTRYT